MEPASEPFHAAADAVTLRLQNEIGGLRNVESEARVGDASLVVHAGEHRYVDIDVVVDLDPSLVVGRTKDASDVLDDAALELDRPASDW